MVADWKALFLINELMSTCSWRCASLQKKLRPPCRTPPRSKLPATRQTLSRRHRTVMASRTHPFHMTGKIRLGAAWWKPAQRVQATACVAVSVVVGARLCDAHYLLALLKQSAHHPSSSPKVPVTRDSEKGATVCDRTRPTVTPQPACNKSTLTDHTSAALGKKKGRKGGNEMDSNTEANTHLAPSNAAGLDARQRRRLLD